KSAIEIRELRLEIAQRVDPGLEVAQQRLHARRWVCLLKHALERTGPISFARPVGDGVAESRLPLVDVLRHGNRDVGHEIQELPAGAGPPRVGARVLLGQVAEDSHDRFGFDVFAAEGLERNEAVERTLELANVLEFESSNLLDDAGPEPDAALL